MSLRNTLQFIVVTVALLGFASTVLGDNSGRKPNIVYILADDMGYGDLSCYGQKEFTTPRIDSLAREGLKFTQHYSGSTVCAPSRCSLMTGFHTGHTEVRGNKASADKSGSFPLSDQAVTVAEILKKKGYATGCFGKWGLGSSINSGDPQKQGFDEFFGYYHQVEAHNYYPPFLYHNGTKIELDGKTYSHDLIADKGLQFIRKSKDKPFFCYLPFTIPHAAMQAPEEYVAPWRSKYEKYENEIARYSVAGPIRNPVAAFPGMMTKLDETVGQIIDLLKELGLEENTIVCFSSDNGPHKAGGHRSIEVFDSNGPLRGLKRDLTEGGIRVPLLVKWPAKIKPGTVTEHVSAFWDFLPTVCELMGEQAPMKTDGIGFLPTLLGNASLQKTHDYLYWEFHEDKGSRAMRAGDWKAIQPANVKINPDGPIELYDLKADIEEKNNLAEKYPEKIEHFRKLFRAARTATPDFPLLPDEKGPATKKSVAAPPVTQSAAQPVAQPTVTESRRPNIYWIIGEDMWPNMGCYGDTMAKTPNIDRFASTGVRYTHAYTTAPVCSASRSAFMTGMYALSIRAHNHRSNRNGNSPLPDGVNLLTDWFREKGYYTANLTEATPHVKGSGKTDWNFTHNNKPFDTNTYTNLKARQPFFAQLNLGETHRGFPKPVRHDPATVKYPTYYPDDPVIRADWAAYMESMSVFDDKVGEVLRWLEEENLLEDTFVILFGDNGVAHVRGKQWCYETGLHVPLIVRWPKNFPRPTNFKPGTVDDRLIDAIDISATSLALAGITVPEKMQGKVFLGEQADSPREYSFGARDRCDETVFRLRTVRDERYRYILNLSPGVPFFQTNRYKINSYPALLRLFKLRDEGKLTADQERIFFALSLPVEELYDEMADPDEMNNLVDSPEHRAVLERLRKALNDWRIQVGDDDEHFRSESPEVIAKAKAGAIKNEDENIRKKIAKEGLEHLTDKILNDLQNF